jgi:hypothetical protein
MATDKEKKDAKIKAKREKIRSMSSGIGVHEPVINKNDYTASLMKALNYYNSAHDNKEKRKWVMAFVQKKDVADLAKVESDYEFRSLGAVVRLKVREQHLEPREVKFITTEINRLKNLVKKTSPLKDVKVEQKVEKPKATIQDKIKDAASLHIGEINGLFDEFLLNGVEPDFAAYLKSNEVSSQVSKLIPQAFVKMKAELEEAYLGKDKQLIEGYSNIKKVKLRKFIKLIDDLETACNQQVVSAKTVRKPRVQKEKPASVLAARVKYMKEFTDLQLKSVNPVSLIGASEAWIYNTKYKKLQVYRALDGQKLSVKGTTLVNYDVAQSSAKTLRKPETTKDVVGMAKKTFATFFKKLTTKDAAVTGRINEECVILKVV